MHFFYCGHKGRSIHCVDAHHLEGLCIGGVCTSCRDESHLQCQANVVSPGGIGGVLKVRRAPALVTSVCNVCITSHSTSVNFYREEFSFASGCFASSVDLVYEKVELSHVYDATLGRNSTRRNSTRSNCTQQLQLGDSH